MNKDTVKELLGEIEAMAADNNLDDAVRLSGEELAHADNAWRVAHNAGADVKQSLWCLAQLAQCHSDLLFRASAYADAYATAVTAMMSLSLDDMCNDSAHEMLALCVIAGSSLEQLGSRMPHDEFTEQHMPMLFSYIASLLYYYYQKTIVAEQTPWHGIAYEMLCDFAKAGAVQQPTVAVGDKNVDPAHPFDLFSDLAGRSIALGLLAE
jgi:hypothetical protein